jgi:hypothetical protein
MRDFAVWDIAKRGNEGAEPASAASSSSSAASSAAAAAQSISDVTGRAPRKEDGERIAQALVMGGWLREEKVTALYYFKSTHIDG